MIKRVHIIFTLWFVCGLAMGDGSPEKTGSEPRSEQTGNQSSIRSSQKRRPIFEQSPKTTPIKSPIVESRGPKTETPRKRIFNNDINVSSTSSLGNQSNSIQMGSSLLGQNSFEMSQSPNIIGSQVKPSGSVGGIRLTKKESSKPKKGIAISSESLEKLKTMMKAQQNGETQTSFELLKPKNKSTNANNEQSQLLNSSQSANSEKTPSKLAKLRLVTPEANKVKREFLSVTESPIVHQIQFLMVAIGSSKIITSDYLTEDVKEGYESLAKNFRLLLRTLSTDSQIPMRLEQFLTAFKDWLQSISVKVTTDVTGAVEYKVKFTQNSFEILKKQLNDLFVELNKNCQTVIQNSLHSDSCAGATKSMAQMISAVTNVDKISIIKTIEGQSVYRIYSIADKNVANLKVQYLKKKAHARLGLFLDDSHNFKKNFASSEMFTPITTALTAIRQAVDMSSSPDLISYAIEFIDKLEAKLVAFHIYSVKGQSVSKYLRITTKDLIEFDELIKYSISKFASFTSDDTTRVQSNLALIRQAINHAFSCVLETFMLELIDGKDVCKEINGAFIQKQYGTQASRRAEKTVSYISQILDKIRHLKSSDVTPIFAHAVHLLTFINQVLKTYPEEIDRFNSVVDLAKNLIPFLNSITSHSYNINGYNVKHNTYEVVPVNNFRDLLKLFGSKLQQLLSTNSAARANSSVTALDNKTQVITQWIDNLIHENDKYYEINDRAKVHYVLPQYQFDQAKKTVVKSKPLRNKVYIHNNKTTLKYLINQLEDHKKLKVTNFYKVMIPALNMFINFYNNGRYTEEDVKKFDDISKKFADVINSIRTVQTTQTGGPVPRKVTRNQFDSELVADLIDFIEKLKDHGKQHWNKPEHENLESLKVIDSLNTIQNFLKGLKPEDSFLVEYPELNGPNLPRPPSSKGLNSSLNNSLNKSSVQNSLNYSIDSSNKSKLNNPPKLTNDDEELEDDFLTINDSRDNSINHLIYEIQNEPKVKEEVHNPLDSFMYSDSQSNIKVDPKRKINPFELIVQEFERRQQSNANQNSNISSDLILSQPTDHSFNSQANLEAIPYREPSNSFVQKFDKPSDELIPEQKSLIKDNSQRVREDPSNRSVSFSANSSVDSLGKYLPPREENDDIKRNLLPNQHRQPSKYDYLFEEEGQQESILFEPTKSFEVDKDSSKSFLKNMNDRQNGSYVHDRTPSDKLLESDFLSNYFGTSVDPRHSNNKNPLSHSDNLLESEDYLLLSNSDSSVPEREEHGSSHIRPDNLDSSIIKFESDLNNSQPRPSIDVNFSKKSSLAKPFYPSERNSMNIHDDSLNLSNSSQGLNDYIPFEPEDNKLLNSRNKSQPGNKKLNSYFEDSLENLNDSKGFDNLSPKSNSRPSVSNQSLRSSFIHPKIRSSNQKDLNDSSKSISDMLSNNQDIPENTPETWKNRREIFKPSKSMNEEDNVESLADLLRVSHKSISSLGNSQSYHEEDSNLLSNLDELPHLLIDNLPHRLATSQLSKYLPEEDVSIKVSTPEKKKRRRVVIVFIEHFNCWTCLDEGNLAYFVKNVLRIK